MPARKSFDVDQAVLAARDVFWRRGYEATSVADLVQATGVGRQSLYDTFGDKAALYARALGGYCTDQDARLVTALADPPGSTTAGPYLPRVRALVAGTAEQALGDPERRGCFVVNAATDGADTGCRSVVTDQVARMQRRITDALRAALAGGELPPTTDVERLARSLVATVVGLKALARAHPDPDLLRDAADVALEALPGAASA